MLETKKFRLTILCTFLLGCVHGQDVPFDKKLFKERMNEFKTAMSHYEDGDAHMEEFPPNYRLAITGYQQAYKFNPKSADLNYKMGLCYFKFDKYQMKQYFEQAYELKPTVAPDVLYYIALSYHLEGEWQQAIDLYTLFTDKANAPETQKLKTSAIKKVQECKNGMDLSHKKARVWIDNVGGEVNTKYPDYAPVISADEAIMVLTSRRPDNEDMVLDGGGYFEDLFVSRRTDGVWSKSKSVGKPLNVRGQHDATIGISPDGHTLFVYNDKKGNGDIYISSDEDGSWSKPKRLGKNINTNYHEPDASLSFDSKRLYFTSNKPGGFGEHDIYYSDWNEEKERWGEAINIGDVLNSAYEERSVFIHPDGETMYFSSTGHNTMGGYDLFYSKLVNGVWQNPVNLGVPLNTPDNDVQLVVAANGWFGYISSYRQGGYGEKDIYLITFLGPEKVPVLSSEDNLIASIAKPIKEKLKEPELVAEGSNMAILTGIIRDTKTQQPLKAEVVLIDNEKNEIVAEFRSDAKTGKYLVSLPGGSNYGIAVKNDGYLFHSENIQIPENGGFRQYEIDIDLKEMKVGQSIVLRNVFFDYSKYSLRDASINELERLVKLLVDNPTLQLEISGHTDSRGSSKDNQILSENRAKSVVDFLISHGINVSRLAHVGYGEAKPVVPHEEINKMNSKTEREDAHQENRRTEFRVTAI